MTLSSLDFREALSRLPAGVTVVTTDGAHGRAGLTCSAMTSVSDQPPTILVCVKRTSRSNAVIKANGVFAVNALAGGQQAIADRFAGRGGIEGSARFEGATWGAMATGAPILEGARMVLDCVIVEMAEVGTHTVFFGEVRAVRLGADGPGLAYVNRHYAEL
jgi:flavin reductase (DIM6/NTAB) family NADH-FMN oxidoreductase RutF